MDKAAILDFVIDVIEPYQPLMQILKRTLTMMF